MQAFLITISNYFDQVNLGVIQENPSSARGTLEILNKHVPIGQNGLPYPILCHGDQLSVERMVETKLSMAFSEDETDQLTGLIYSKTTRIS